MQSPFLDYIDHIAMELIRANNAIQPAPINLHEAVESLDSLQHFINYCLPRANTDLSRTQALLNANVDNQLFLDLIRPALKKVKAISLINF